MADREKSQREAEVRLIVMACAERAGVLARCRPARRRSDLAMVFLRGPRQAVLGLPLKVFDALEDYDVEIIRSGSQEDRYLLVMAVTEALGSQEIRTPERRAKLRRRLEREEA
ncbi:MAG: hypothetical protein WD314_15025 [Trueperaceae bacterium]